MARTRRRNRDEQTVLIASALLQITVLLILLIVGAGLLEHWAGLTLPEPVAWSVLAVVVAGIGVRTRRADKGGGSPRVGDS